MCIHRPLIQCPHRQTHHCSSRLLRPCEQTACFCCRCCTVRRPVAARSVWVHCGTPDRSGQVYRSCSSYQHGEPVCFGRFRAVLVIALFFYEKFPPCMSALCPLSKLPPAAFAIVVPRQLLLVAISVVLAIFVADDTLVYRISSCSRRREAVLSHTSRCFCKPRVLSCLRQCHG